MPVVHLMAQPPGTALTILKQCRAINWKKCCGLKLTAWAFCWMPLRKKYFGSIPRGPEVDKMVIPAPVIEKDRYVSYTDNYIRLPLLNIVYPTVPNFHKDMAAISCLAEILGQGNNSILYQQLVKTQLA